MKQKSVKQNKIQSNLNSITQLKNQKLALMSDVLNNNKIQF